MFTIILIVYAFFLAICITLTVHSHIQKKQWFFNKVYKDIIFCLLAAVFFPVVMYLACGAIYYRNRPRPFPKKTRKWMKKDLVSFKGKTMSIARYNATHKKKFTLEQVYGKKYVKSITPQDKADFDMPENVFCVKDGLPDDDITTAALYLAKALFSGDFSDLLGYLDNDVRLISYCRRMTIIGRDVFIDYWKGVLSKLNALGPALEIEVKKNSFYGHSVVSFKQRNVIEHFVFFHVECGKIRTAVLTPRQQQPIMVRYYDLEKPRIDYKIVMTKKGEPIAPEANRMPCLICGALSDTLEWYRLEVDSGSFAHIGQVSVCPHCKAQAEFYPEIFLRKDNS